MPFVVGLVKRERRTLDTPVNIHGTAGLLRETPAREVGRVDAAPAGKESRRKNVRVIGQPWIAGKRRRYRCASVPAASREIVPANGGAAEVESV